MNKCIYIFAVLMMFASQKGFAGGVEPAENVSMPLLLDRVQSSRGDEFYNALQAVTGDWPSTVGNLDLLLEIAANRHDQVLEPEDQGSRDTFGLPRLRSLAILHRLANAIREGPIGPHREAIARAYIQHLARAMHDKRYSEYERASITGAVQETIYYPVRTSSFGWASTVVIPNALEGLVIEVLSDVCDSSLPLQVRSSALSGLALVASNYGARPFGSPPDAVKGLLLGYLDELESDAQKQNWDQKRKQSFQILAERKRDVINYYGVYCHSSIPEADYRALMESSLEDLATAYFSGPSPSSQIAFEEMTRTKERRAESRKYLLASAEMPAQFGEIFGLYARPVLMLEPPEEKDVIDYLLDLLEEQIREGSLSGIRDKHLAAILYSLQSAAHYREANMEEAQDVPAPELHGRQRVWSLLLMLLEYPLVRQREEAVEVLPAVMAEYPETVETFVPAMESALQSAQEEQAAISPDDGLPRRHELKSFVDALTEAMDTADLIRKIQEGKAPPDAKVVVTNVFGEEISFAP